MEEVRAVPEAEMEEVREAVHPEQTFAALWTKKEAYFKLRGTGITKELREILASPHPDVRLTTEIYSEAGFAFTIAETASKEGAS
jgi:phosphopantetheinyl transferase